MSTARFDKTAKELIPFMEKVAAEVEENNYLEKLEQTEKLEKTEKTRLSDAIKTIKALGNGCIIPLPFELINLNKNRRDDKDITTNQEFFQLVQSIKDIGIIHRPVITCDEESIFPLEGHRRILALKHLNKPIECEVRHMKSEELQILLSLSANTVRKDWDIVSTSKAISDLYKTGNYTNEKLGEMFHKDRKVIERLRKIANWKKDITDLIKDNTDAFNQKFLLTLASKSIPEEEIMKILQSKLGLLEDEKQPRLSPNEKKYIKLIQRKNLPPEKIEFLQEVLIELNYISKDFVFNKNTVH